MPKRNKKKTRVLDPVVVIKQETKEDLDKLKIIPREPYDAVIKRIIAENKSSNN